MLTTPSPGKALVTGASSGIGAAFVQLLAQEGYELAITARNIDSLNRVAGVLAASLPVQIHTIAADLSRSEDIAGLYEELKERDFNPDVVVNNAGFGLLGDVLDLSREDQLNMIDLNVRGASDVALRFAPDMVARGQGGIINVVSAAGYMPMPHKAVYAASKSYLLSFSRSLSYELRKTGVTVTAICPGPVATGFQERAGMNEAPMIKYGRSASAEDTAAAGWRAFKQGRALEVPGIGTKISTALAHIAPRWLLLPSISLAMKPLASRSFKLGKKSDAG